MSEKPKDSGNGKGSRSRITKKYTENFDSIFRKKIDKVTYHHLKDSDLQVPVNLHSAQ